ncbi:alkylated DNA repair protein alkB homolog 8-like [Amphibalanus amphitrite]|uniref:alkylated DNA repair protein alkB homolog 8-like n=1 Tax=Amphibalanus amphitrite TaxID=1232801 RepID=UPI001C8FFE08|nr:alkylated DNA repair protein alkB homolog 8-like [Amphibalanus amphitrite]XP_043219620.1 alkylated DNA repair protein alkB homolog 8-like [Amphibalanus amphitrite]
MMLNSKNEKKLLRKKQRLFALLSKGKEIQFSSSPTEIVVVCNSGLTTGASRESILEKCLPYAPASSVHMVPGRQFCFIQFADKEAAQQVMQALDGVDGQNGEPPLYLAYAERVPVELCSAPLEFRLPPGAALIMDLLSAEEEELILGQLHWPADGSMKHRQVLHFGYEFDYGTNNVDPSRPLAGGLPGWVEPLVTRLMDGGHLVERPDQMTINHYLPGQGIPAHVDTHSAFTDQLVSISLGSDTTIEFCRPPPHGATVAVRLPRRSALVMDGEARYLWTHCIVPRHSDITLTSDGELTLTRRGTRVSLTLRRLRRDVCRCRFPQQCDSQQQRGAEEKRSNGETGITEQLERTYVANVYEQIADHFSCTRHKPWPRVERFVRGLPAGSVLLDVGCGNGKYLGLNPHTFEVGVDQSSRLCSIGGGRGHQTVTAGCLPLPVRSAACDAVICIAVLHHLATRERRVAALAEIGRALRAGGRALIYVWALEQRQGTRAAGYLKPGRQQRVTETETASGADTAELPLPVHTNRTEFKQQDMLVPWKLRSGGRGGGDGGEEVHHRFYHVYRSGELEEDVQAAGGLSVLESYHDQGNWCVMLQKDEDVA